MKHLILLLFALPLFSQDTDSILSFSNGFTTNKYSQYDTIDVTMIIGDDVLQIEKGYEVKKYCCELYGASSKGLVLELHPHYEHYIYLDKNYIEIKETVWQSKIIK